MEMLESDIVVVTGGSLGIGLEIAKKCAYEGAKVIIAARGIEDLKNAVEELKNISNNNHEWYQLDVSRYDEVSLFAKWCSEKFPYINGLVNCAGIYGPIGKTCEVDMDKFTETIQINFLGTVYMCHSFYPLMLKSEKRKKIINFSGGGAATPFPNYSAYATSKIAIVRFTENLGQELLGQKVDVNCVAPGFVITRLHQQTLEAGPQLVGGSFYDNTKKQIKNGGVSPEKAASLAIFLLSSSSDGITGKFISAPWDNWQEKEFQDALRNDKDFATLRRIDNRTFYKKN